MNKPLAALPLHSLKHLTPEHKVAFFEMAEIYIDVMSGGVEELQSPRVQKMITIAQSVQEHTRLIPFKKIVPCWEPNWLNGTIKCTLLSYNGQVPVLDLGSRLKRFLEDSGKKPKDWRLHSAKLDRETNIITFWAQDMALKRREEAKRRKLLSNGENKKGKKKIKVNTRAENLQAAKQLSTEELMKLAQARGVAV